MAKPFIFVGMTKPKNAQSPAELAQLIYKSQQLKLM